MAIGYPKGSEVISGMRKSCDLFIEIDVEKAMKDGMQFFESKNKVILSAGVDGFISRVLYSLISGRNTSRKSFLTRTSFTREERRFHIF